MLKALQQSDLKVFKLVFTSCPPRFSKSNALFELLDIMPKVSMSKCKRGNHQELSYSTAEVHQWGEHNKMFFLSFQVKCFLKWRNLKVNVEWEQFFSRVSFLNKLVLWWIEPSQGHCRTVVLQYSHNILTTTQAIISKIVLQCHLYFHKFIKSLYLKNISIFSQFSCKQVIMVTLILCTIMIIFLQHHNWQYSHIINRTVMFSIFLNG